MTGRVSSVLGVLITRCKKRVIIGKKCRISPDAYIKAREGVITLNDGCKVSPGAIIQGNVTMGCKSSVQAYSIIVGYGTKEDREGEIIIGENVMIASHVMIIGANHNFSDPEATIKSQGLTRKSIVIEDDVWIAGRVNITAGVRIGKGAVIGAGAVVTSDIPPYSIAVGVPAKVIKSRK
jgi:acetyltransferase-like isoleucine patch superfamily enzyme